MLHPHTIQHKDFKMKNLSLALIAAVIILLGSSRAGAWQLPSLQLAETSTITLPFGSVLDIQYLFDSLSSVTLTLANKETQIVFHTFTIKRTIKYA